MAFQGLRKICASETQYSFLKSASSTAGAQAAQSIFSSSAAMSLAQEAALSASGAPRNVTKLGPSPHAVTERLREENVRDCPSAAVGRAVLLAPVSRRASRHRNVLTTVNPDFLTRCPSDPLPAPWPGGKRLPGPLRRQRTSGLSARHVPASPRGAPRRPRAASPPLLSSHNNGK